MLHKYLLIFFFIGTFFIPKKLYAQCHIIPIPLEDRIANSDVIVLAKAGSPVSFWNPQHTNIFTNHPLQIIAILKGKISDTDISLITEGGTVNDIRQEVSASLEIDHTRTYVFLLQKSNITVANTLTYEGYGSIQGALALQNGFFADPSFTEQILPATLFQKIASISGHKATKPDGTAYTFNTLPQSRNLKTNVALITSVNPTPLIAGSVDVNQILVIKGTGFGTSGKVEFSNADDGGKTLITSPIPASDIVSWSNTEIHIKVPRQAGTGKIVVNGEAEAKIEIKFSILEVNNTFYGYTQETRQTLKMVNQDNHGGYTFYYNKSFLQNSNAVAAFERAIENWRCNTGMNYRISGAITNIDSAITDHVNVVIFGNLPAGVLGRAISWYRAQGSNVCNKANTIWYTDEIDVVFAANLPAGISWNYGPAASVQSAKTYDFESVALHEMGHAHGLGHIIAPDRIMNYSINNGSDKRVLTASDIEAGIYKINQSKGYYCFIPKGVVGPLVSLPANECVLPSTILSISGRYDAYAGNIVGWHTSFENNVSGYSIWRSSGQAFDSIGVVTSKGTGVQDLYYAFSDTTSDGNTTYRYHLFELKTNAPKRTSDTITIDIDKNAYFEFYPTYVKTNDIMTIVPHNLVAGTVSLNIYDATGKKILHEDLLLSTAGSKIHFRLPVLQEGIYIYHIQKDSATLKGKMLIKNQ